MVLPKEQIMASEKEYRNSIRSRRAIREAFTALLNEKQFDKITVTDIVKRADINRSTFYAHYPDVQGLLEEIGNEIGEAILQLVAQISNKNIFADPLSYILAVYRAIESNMDLYRALARSQFSYRLAARLKQELVSHILQTLGLSGAPLTRARLIFFVSGMVDVSMMWYRGELDCTLEQIGVDLANTLTKLNAETLLDEWMN